MRSEKAEGGLTLRILAAWDLCFVAIAVFLGGGKDGVASDIKLADTLEMTVYPAFFDGKLRIVTDMTEQTAAAFGKNGAIGFGSGFGGRDDFFAFCKAVRGKHFQHACFNDVANGGFGNEKHVAIVLGNTHTFVGQVGDRKGDEIVFL